MGRATFTVAQIFRALNDCAKGYSHRMTAHSILVTFGKKTAVLPKGVGGGERAHRIRVADHKAKLLVTLFELNHECVKKHLPGLLD